MKNTIIQMFLMWAGSRILDLGYYLFAKGYKNSYSELDNAEYVPKAMRTARQQDYIDLVFGDVGEE